MNIPESFAIPFPFFISKIILRVSVMTLPSGEVVCDEKINISEGV